MRSRYATADLNRLYCQKWYCCANGDVPLGHQHNHCLLSLPPRVLPEIVLSVIMTMALLFPREPPPVLLATPIYIARNGAPGDSESDVACIRVATARPAPVLFEMILPVIVTLLRLDASSKLATPLPVLPEMVLPVIVTVALP